MANHGYVSRTGITTFAEAANACQIAVSTVKLWNKIR